MARVLHVEDDPEIRKLVADIFAMTNYELSQFDSVESAERSGGGYDLYICGTMGKHSDGLIFALTQEERGNRVIVIADQQKFTRLPFLATARLRQKENALKALEHALRR